MACFQAQLRVNMVAIFIPGPWRMGRRRKKRGGYGRHRPPDSVTPFRIHPSGAMSTVGATTFLPHFVVTWRASHKIYFKMSKFFGTKLFACWKIIFQKKSKSISPPRYDDEHRSTGGKQRLLSLFDIWAHCTPPQPSPPLGGLSLAPPSAPVSSCWNISVSNDRQQPAPVIRYLWRACCGS